VVNVGLCQFANLLPHLYWRNTIPRKEIETAEENLKPQIDELMNINHFIKVSTLHAGIFPFLWNQMSSKHILSCHTEVIWLLLENVCC
jgi:hypothetical protein